MKNILVISFLALCSVSGFAMSNENKVDNSSYDDLYSEYIANKIWKLNYDLSETKFRMENFSIKIVPVENSETKGDFYRRYGYVRGVEMGTTKYLEVKEISDTNNEFLYEVYDARRNMLIEKVKLDDQERLVVQLINDDVLVFEHKELADDGCRTYESKMECLMRTDPSEYLRVQDEAFRKKSQEANKK